MRRATRASTRNNENPLHRQEKAGSDRTTRRPQQGQSGINNLPALHTHNETGRDVIQLLVTRTDTSTFRIWPGCIQIRPRATRGGLKPNKKPKQDKDDSTSSSTKEQEGAGKDHQHQQEHAAGNTANARDTSLSTTDVGADSGAWATPTRRAETRTTWTRKATLSVPNRPEWRHQRDSTPLPYDTQPQTPPFCHEAETEVKRHTINLK